jgi:hypothetical protein
MDQKKGEGHHIITEKATGKLFTGRTEIDGMDQKEYARQLDEAQEYADRSPADFIDSETLGTSGNRSFWESITDPGKTWKPYYMDRDGQREHSMADPALSADENLGAIKGFVSGQLDNAHAAHAATRDFAALDSDKDGHLTGEEIEDGMDKEKLRDSAAYLSRSMGDLEELSNDEWGDENDGVTLKDLQTSEMRSLGAASHALQDSYSSAHMFRDTDNPADPHAPVKGINTFSPGGQANTHDKRFDEVAVDTDHNLERDSDQAAAAATAEILNNYYEHRDDSDSDSHNAFAENVNSFYEASEEGVKVYDDKNDPDWQNEVEERLPAP